MASASLQSTPRNLRMAPTPTAKSRPLDVSRSYREHARFTWRVLRHLGVPSAIVEDAVHDVFVVVSRRADRFDTTAPIRPWLVGIARRVARDYHKASARHQRRKQALQDHGRGAHDGNVDQAEALRLVRELLESLPQSKRMVMVLADLEGWTAPEISEALEIPVNTVYTRLSSARKRLESLADRIGLVREDV